MPMSTNAINKTLQAAYPAAVFLAVLASVGMKLVQAESSGYSFFPNYRHDQYKYTLTSKEVKACSEPDRYKLFNHLSCSDGNGAMWMNQTPNQTNDAQQFVNNTAQERDSQSLN